ncbi:type I polyketide synthase [Aspergillus stella-maris]|uniref:type I polyketide synthase n=1 Tax=Aspergillus stella-maris TaxID=1810926 RepID=UPI003CCE128F
MRNLDMNGSTNGVDHGKVSDDGSTTHEPIAIVGIGLRLPGKIHTAEALWSILSNGKETSGPVPSSRYNATGFYSASKRPGTTGVQRGHFLDESDAIDKLDTSLFNMGAAEVAKLDPQQRMLLEVVWECMENAGQTGWRGTDTGVFVGTWGDDWQDLLNKDPQQTGGMLNVSGAGDFAISNRISYEYNLTGPSMTIKAACVSSMIALHQASQSLKEGACSAAIVAGTNLILTPTQTIAQTEAGVLSPTGQCRTFDASANGYARGEAINAILIKKLSDAVRDQDPIRAVIRATAVNCDGMSNGISAPNPVAHEKLIRRAYKVAGLDPLDTPSVEAHGTGTPSGDPLEMRGLAGAFGGHRETYVGSVKANVGHGEGASGVTSIIKAILMLENRAIPPQVNFETPNPNIPFQAAGMVVPIEAMPWPVGRPERISVNSFGITGANAHAIIESAAAHGVRMSTRQRDLSAPSLFVLSAHTQGSLKTKAQQIQEYVERAPERASNLAYTLSCRREHLTHRAFCVLGSKHDSEIIYPAEGTKKTPVMYFVFTGQGAQCPAMGKELIGGFPQFRDDLVRMGHVLAKSPHPPTWDLVDELLKPEPKSRINEAELSQPLCTAIQIALVNLLVSTVGISPSAVVGHSSGEIAAAYAAGAITADEAILIAYYRGRAACHLRHSGSGAMVAVGMGRAEAKLYLDGDVVVACDNSPNSVTLSGSRDALESVVEQIKADDKDLFVRFLKTDGMAYHSSHMAEVGPGYQENLRNILHPSAAKIPFISTVTGKRIACDTLLDGAYWRRNLESPVKFYPAVKTLLASQQQSDQLFLEIGPHSALSGPLRQIFKNTVTKGRLSYLPSLIRGKNSVESILELCGQLYLSRVDLHLQKLNSGDVTLTDLPPYPWQHDVSHWAETRATREWRSRPFPPHELLGSRILEGNDIEPTWRNLLRLRDAPWLQDHKVLNDMVFPCAGYIAMAGEAIRQITGADSFTIRHFNIQSAMVLTDEQTVEISTSFKPSPGNNMSWYDFTIYSHNGNVWTKHCDGQARGGRDQQLPETTVFDYDDVPLPRQVRAPYPIFSRVGVHYGPTFQGLEDVSAMPGQRAAVASLCAAPVTGSDYPLHPTTIDQCLQLLGLAAADGLSHHFEEILLPTGVDHIHISSKPLARSDSPMRVIATASAAEGALNGVNGEIIVASDDKILLSARGCRLTTFEQQDEKVSRDDRIAAARLHWRPDLDFVQLDSLMVSEEKDLDALKLMETYVFEHAPYYGHWDKFHRWIEDFIDRGRRGENTLVKNSDNIVALNQLHRQALIQNLQGKVLDRDYEFSSVADLVTRLVDNAVEVFKGEMQILDVYIRDDGLTKLYAMTGDRIDSTNFFITAGHTNPTMRILEIGAGTGGTTLLALQALTSINGEPTYSNYTFTDVSSGFFTAAKDRFELYPGLEFKTLDIGRDPVEQGFEPGSYDLIIASNVIHATETLSVTLKNVRTLLHPRGRFFLQELTPAAAKMINLIMGPLPGWWLGEADDRAMEPIISPKRWDFELRRAGFDGIECLVHDDPNGRNHLGVNMISRPSRSLISDFPSVTLLLREGQVGSQPVEMIVQALKKKDYHIDLHCLSLGHQSQLPVYQDIISLLEIDAPFVDNISTENFALLQQVVNHLVSGSSKLLWVMGSAQIGPVTEPAFGLTLGLMRSIRAELSPSIATLEIDRLDPRVATTAIDVFEKFQETAGASSGNPDHEYAMRNGIVHVGRFHWTGVSKELAQSYDTSEYPLRMEKTRGPLPNEAAGAVSKVFIWTPHLPARARLGDNDITVNVAYSDVEGSSGSGTVAAVGPSVCALKPGDRVMVLVGARDGKSSLAKSINLEEAASMALPFATVIYSLIMVANIRRGQTVFVHGAATAAVHAAIQICRMLGVEVYASAANQSEAGYLTAALGLFETNILDSSHGVFFPALLDMTNNRGVDVVLFDTPDSEELEACWRCLAPRGKVGRLPEQYIRGLDIKLVESNKSFASVDINTLQDLYQGLFEEILSLYHQGHITPIAVKLITADQQLENQLTKVSDTVSGAIIEIPENPQPRNAPIPPGLSLWDDAAYLLVGGLGGLGQSVSTYLIERGARHLIYLSRKAGSLPEHERFAHELESQGCSVQMIQADVGDTQAMKFAIAQVQEERPIAGVLHLGMVLADQHFLSMDYSNWCAALKPRVSGTWNIHEALLAASANLDFFVIFGSVSGSFGIAHQANYGAANTFQDAFVRYRHSLGLPASILNIGAMASVGYVSENKGVEEYFRGAGMPFLDEGDFFHVLHQSIVQQFSSHSDESITNRSQLTLGLRSTKPMDDPSNRVLWKHDRRADIYRNIEAARLLKNTGSSTGTGDSLATFMSAVRSRSTPSLLDDPETLCFVTHEIGVHIYELMLRPVEELDVSKALVTLGVDSLVIVEIRNWLRRRLEVEASTLEILNGGTIEMLGRVTVERLRRQYVA